MELSGLGQITWGAHIAHLYETQQDLLDVLIPYLKLGLENNESCWWYLLAPLGEEEARKALSQALPEAERCLATGQLSLVDQAGWYPPGGAFVPERFRQGLSESLARAREGGYAGLRLAADVSWLTHENWKDFSDYERSLNETLADQRLIVLCSFSSPSAGAAEIVDIARTHTHVVAKRDARWELLETGSPPRLKSLGSFASPAPQMITRLRDSLIVDANDAFVELFGYERREVIGRTTLELGLYSNPSDRAPLVDRVLREGAVLDFEASFRAKSGRALDLILFLALIEEPGEPYLSAACYDITRYKQAEAALRKSEERYRDLIDMAPDAIYLVTRDATVVLANAAAARLAGCSPDELVSTLFTDTYLPEERDVFSKRVELIKGGPLHFERPFVRRNGEVVPVEVSLSPLRRGQCQAIIRDITERKQAQAMIEREAARKDALLRVARSLNWQLDLAKVLRTVCRETCQVMNVSLAVVHLWDPKSGTYTIADAWGVPPEALAQLRPLPGVFWEAHLVPDRSYYLHPDVSGDVSQPNARTIQALGIRTVLAAPLGEGADVVGYLAIATRDLVRMFTENEIQLLKGLASEAGLAITNARLFRSVTTQREQVQALNARLVEAQEAERRQVARELHDQIGQVLTAVSADLQTLEPTSDPAAHAARLEGSLRLVDEALRQVRELALELRPALLDDLGLGAALEWYLERVGQHSRFRRELVLEPPELLLPPQLATTLFRLAQIALTNVVRHAHAQHVCVSVCEQAGQVELVVRDDGIGFDVPAALERAAHGASVGLVSLRERAQLAGGQLEIRSAPGQGTEVWARFPLA